MNKLFTKIGVALVGIAMAVGVGVAIGSNKNATMVKADSTTFVAGTDTSATTTLSKDDVTITTTSGTFSRADNYRIYANNSMTMSVSSGNITEVVFTISQNTFTANVGTWTEATKTWTGEASSITFSASGGQVRITQIDVTYGSGGGGGGGSDPYITVNSTLSGYTGGSSSLSFTFGNLESTFGVSSSDTDKVTVGEPSLDEVNGKGTVQVNFRMAGSATLSFKDGEDELATCAVTVNQTTLTLNKNTLYLEQNTNETLVATCNTGVATWSSNNAKITVNSSGKVTAAADAPIGSTATITATSSIDDSVSATCIVHVEKAHTWDLSTNSYDASPTEELISWSSSYATMKNEKSTSGTAVTNYIPTTRTSTRTYTGHLLTITPKPGYSMIAISMTAASEGFANAAKDSTWTNATASANGSNVFVTVTNAFSSVTCKFTANSGFTSIKVFYEAKWAESFLATFTCTGAVTGHENGDISVANPTTVWGDFNTAFTALSDETKASMKTESASQSGTTMQQALARYDLVVRKYNILQKIDDYNDYIGRFSEGGANAAARIDIGNIAIFGSNPTILVIVIISLTGIITIGGYFLLRRKYEDR